VETKIFLKSASQVSEGRGDARERSSDLLLKDSETLAIIAVKWRMLYEDVLVSFSSCLLAWEG
jgi:hypothetical protein